MVTERSNKEDTCMSEHTYAELKRENELLKAENDCLTNALEAMLVHGTVLANFLNEIVKAVKPKE